MNRLLNLMRQLGADAALAKRYLEDRDGVIAQFDLSDEERAALVNKDFDEIKRLTGLKDGQFSTNTTVTAYDG